MFPFIARCATAGPKQCLGCALCSRNPIIGACSVCGRRCCRGCTEEASRQCWSCLGYSSPQEEEHSRRGNMADDSVTCPGTNQCRSSEELEKLFNHLGSTLFRDNLTGLHDLWWRVEKEIHDDRIEVHFCTTPANRCVLFRCKSCRQQVCAPHGHWVDRQKYTGLRRNLLTWFCNPHVVDIGAIDTASREL